MSFPGAKRRWTLYTLGAFKGTKRECMPRRNIDNLGGVWCSAERLLERRANCLLVRLPWVEQSSAMLIKERLRSVKPLES